MFDSYRSPFPPLEGTTPAPRALFIARWGTLFECPPDEVPDPEDVRLFPGVAEVLFRLVRSGWKVYLIGNEDAVAGGRRSAEDYQRAEEAAIGVLERVGIRVSGSYAGLDDPDSVFRLPNTGAFYHAHHSDGIDLERSWVIGDSTLALVAGWRAGLRQIGVRTGRGLEDGAFHVDPDFVAADLATALLELLQRQEALRR